MSGKLDPKSPKAIRASGIAFFVIGMTFFVMGMTNREMMAFTGVGAAFFVIGLGLIAKARKAQKDETGEGDA
ncbi:hypothetical protein BH10PSE1_BH10PSE1_27170 [soil metagenome]